MSGIKHWKDVPSQLRNKANQELLHNIADNEALVSMTINSRGANPCLYIPMPRVHHTGIECCFFLPIRVSDDDMAFDLFLLVDDHNSLGFRFEPSDPEDWTHNYSHVQMNKNMKRFPAKGIPEWIPDSYPAFAIRTSGPLEMFLSMVTSIHGYQGGITTIMQEIFKDRPIVIREYLETLRKLLG